MAEERLTMWFGHVPCAGGCGEYTYGRLCMRCSLRVQAARQLLERPNPWGWEFKSAIEARGEKYGVTATVREEERMTFKPGDRVCWTEAGHEGVVLAVSGSYVKVRWDKHGHGLFAPDEVRDWVASKLHLVSRAFPPNVEPPPPTGITNGKVYLEGRELKVGDAVRSTLSLNARLRGTVHAINGTGLAVHWTHNGTAPLEPAFVDHTRSLADVARVSPPPAEEPLRVGDRVRHVAGADHAIHGPGTVRSLDRHPGYVGVHHDSHTHDTSAGWHFWRPESLSRLPTPPAEVVPKHAGCEAAGPCDECEGYAGCTCSKCPAQNNAPTIPAPRMIPEYPAICACGAPAVDLLLTRECSRGKACEGRKPEPRIVAWQDTIAGIGGALEPGWIAEAENDGSRGGAPTIIEHAATREAAIGAVRRRLGLA